VSTDALTDYELLNNPISELTLPWKPHLAVVVEPRQ